MSEIATRFHADGDKLIVQRTQDVEPHLEHAKALRSIGAGKGDDLWHAASFPSGVVEMYMTQHGITMHEMLSNPEHFERMLNDPDLAGFRVTHKVIA